MTLSVVYSRPRSYLLSIVLSIGKQRLLIVGLLLLWSVTLLGYCIYRTNYLNNVNDFLAIGMLWNLFLAVLPLLWSSAFQSASRDNRRGLAILFFTLWILFFPNAPYILTDLIHLRPKPYMPVWYSLAMLLSCAATGTILGYLSLLNIQDAVEKKNGALSGWGVVIGSLMLSAFGIYLGRFLRWNSWDAVTNPLGVLKSVMQQFIDPGPFPHPVPVTLIFGISLIVGYLSLRVLSSSVKAG